MRKGESQRGVVEAAVRDVGISSNSVKRADDLDLYPISGLFSAKHASRKETDIREQRLSFDSDHVIVYQKIP